MSQDALRKAMDAVRTQLQAELDAQLAALERQHAEALEAARREARDEADARWQAELEKVRADAESRLNAALAEAAADAERRVASETGRARAEAEQQAGQALEQARQDAASQANAEAERTLESERTAHAERMAEVQRDLEGARERIAALEEARARADAERQQEAAAAEAHLAERGAAERETQLAAFERLLNSVRAMSAARSLSDVLAALAEGAAAEASRAAVLVPAGQDLEAFRASGFSPERIVHRPADEDVLRTAMRSRRAMPVVPESAPAFARLAPERAGLAAPILVGGRAVAVLYADNSLASSPEVPAAWPEAVQVLCLHASAALSHLTAVRTAQAARLMRSPAPAPAPAAEAPATGAESEEAARRYARLLVSEIKLYNESAVRIGREKRDLLHRLRPEIERARRVYEERVPATLAGRAAYFDEELCQILAGGDAALLGREAVWP